MRVLDTADALHHRGPFGWALIISFNAGATIQFNKGEIITTTARLGSFRCRPGNQWAFIDLTGTIKVLVGEQDEPFPGPPGTAANVDGLGNLTVTGPDAAETSTIDESAAGHFPLSAAGNDYTAGASKGKLHSIPVLTDAQAAPVGLPFVPGGGYDATGTPRALIVSPDNFPLSASPGVMVAGIDRGASKSRLISLDAKGRLPPGRSQVPGYILASAGMGSPTNIIMFQIKPGATLDTYIYDFWINDAGRQTATALGNFNFNISTHAGALPATLTAPQKLDQADGAFSGTACFTAVTPGDAILTVLQQVQVIIPTAAAWLTLPVQSFRFNHSLLSKPIARLRAGTNECFVAIANTVGAGWTGASITVVLGEE